jgi:hypothetical protein
MNRRSWLSLAGATLVGCKGRKPTVGPAKPADKSTTLIKAGGFSVTVPTDWSATAVVEKVPMRPVYSTGEWKFLQSNSPSDLPLAVNKPDYGNRPQHWAVRLPAAVPPDISIEPGEPGNDPTAPQILIHKAEEWSAIFADGIEGRDKSAEMLQSLRKKTDEELSAQEPELVPAFMDGHLGFRCLKQRLDFEGGHGIRLIAQWNIEPDLIRKGRLHYLFLGLSDDNTCQVIATFPLNLPGLPGDYDTDPEHLGKSVKRFEEFVEHYDAYETEAKLWLEEHAAEISPSLETLDTMLKSIVVRRWE